MLTDINWNEKLCNFDDVDDMCEEFSRKNYQNLKTKTTLLNIKNKEIR